MSNRDIDLFSLGSLHISDFVKKGATSNKGKEDLSLFLEAATGAVRLHSVVDPDLMYGEYWYRSGINKTMTTELSDIVKDCRDAIPTKKGDIWLDVACNDGTLLKFVPKKMVKVGIDPADNSYTNESRQVADLVIQDFFSAQAYRQSKFGQQKAKIITIIAMFYDVDNPLEFLQDVEAILDDEGLLVLQMSYTPLMLRQLAFDNICHEHVYYYTLKSITKLLNESGLKVVDCQLNDINGGSFRVYARKATADPTRFKTSPYRDVAQFRIESLLALEAQDRLDEPAPYLEFYERIKD